MLAFLFILGLGQTSASAISHSAASATPPAAASQTVRLTTDGDWKGHLRWAPDGSSLHFTRIKDGRMELAVLPLKEGKAAGAAFAFLKPAPGLPQFDAHLSPDGQRIAYVHDILQGTDGKLNIYICAADGTGAKAAIPHKAFEESPRWSPDGKELLWVSTRDGNQELYRSTPSGENIARLTNHPGEDNQPWWSPDGKEIVFSSNRNGGARLYKMKSDGSSVKRLCSSLSGHGAESWPGWSPKGERIAFSRLVAGQWDLFLVRPVEGAEAMPLAGSAGHDTFPAWSPDGQRIAFCSTRDGGTDLYLVDVPPLK